MRDQRGDAPDSYHRYWEDMQLLADAGLNSYRFGVEWARIEPRPGQFLRAAFAHYRRMIDTAAELGLTTVVTLHHFTSPAWFTAEGGFLGDSASARLRAYLKQVWGHWEPTYRLVAVDRETFVRTPKPSLAWLGQVARSGGSSVR